MLIKVSVWRNLILLPPAVGRLWRLGCSSSGWSSLWSGRWRRKWWPRGRQRAPTPASWGPPGPAGASSFWGAALWPGGPGRGCPQRSGCGSEPGRWWRWERGWTEPGCSPPRFCPLKESVGIRAFCFRKIYFQPTTAHWGLVRDILSLR